MNGIQKYRNAGNPTGGVPGEGEEEQGQQTYHADMVPWLKKYNWIILFLIILYFSSSSEVATIIEETFVAQKKCAYFQSGTQFAIKTLSSTKLGL